MPYPGGIGGPAARPVPFLSHLCLASTLLSIQGTWIQKFFRKNIGDFWGTFGGRSGVPPILDPEEGLALLRVKPSVPQCSCASEPSRARKVPKNKQAKRTSLLFWEIEDAGTSNVQKARNFKDRIDVAVVCSKRW